MLPSLRAFVHPTRTGPDEFAKFLHERELAYKPTNIIGLVGPNEESSRDLVDCIERFIEATPRTNILVEFTRNGALSDRDITCNFWRMACKQSLHLQRTNEQLHAEHLQTHCMFLQLAWYAAHPTIRYTISIASKAAGTSRHCFEFHF